MEQPEGGVQPDGQPDPVAVPGQLPDLTVLTGVGVEGLLGGGRSTVSEKRLSESLINVIDALKLPAALYDPPSPFFTFPPYMSVCFNPLNPPGQNCTFSKLQLFWWVDLHSNRFMWRSSGGDGQVDVIFGRICKS